MSQWTRDEITRIGRAEELEIASLRRDGSLRKPVTIWVVPHDASLYVRSVNGRTAAWFRGTQERHEGRIWGGGVEKRRHLRGRRPRHQRRSRCCLPGQIPPIRRKHP